MRLEKIKARSYKMAVELKKTSKPYVFYAESQNLKNLSNKPVKVYYCYFVVKSTGKQFKKKLGDELSGWNLQRAYTEAVKIKDELERGEYQEPKKQKKWTLEELFNFYVEVNPYKDQENDIYKIKGHLSFLGDKELDKISMHDIKKLQEKTAHLANETQRKYLSLLTRLSNFAIKSNLCTGLKISFKLPKVNNEVNNFLSLKQIEELLKVLDKEPNQTLANALKMALFSGMRRGEILSLSWDKIDLENRTLTLSETKSGKTKHIPINELGYSVLMAQKEISGNHEYVFITDKGTPYKNVDLFIKKMKQYLPEGFRVFHDSRHSYASQLAMNGIDILTISKLLTHGNSRVTQRYAHLADKHLQEQSNKMAEILPFARKTA